MKINFVGNFQSGYVGEVGDAVHLAREMEALGHTVQRVPQDIWREYVLGERNPDWEDKLPIRADINIICKWHHFYDEQFIFALRHMSKAPVFYWVWDYMNDNGLPDWHIRAIEAADMYLGNDVRDPIYRAFNTSNIYYFPFDVADGSIPRFQTREKNIDVAFFGSWIPQGDRQAWLREINETNPITAFSWNYQDWPQEFNARPPVYGTEFNRAVGQSKIILGFSVEPDCWGYWSNRVGKVLLAGGFLLYQYAPGMELFLRDGVEYFSSVDEAREKIDHYLIADTERESIAKIGWMIGQDRFSSYQRVKDLMILIDRYLKGYLAWKI